MVGTQTIPWKVLSALYESQGQPGFSSTWLLLSAWCLVVSRYTEADPLVCDINGAAGHDLLMGKFQSKVTGSTRLGIGLPGEVEVMDLLEHPQRYLRDMADKPMAHTAVFICSSDGDGVGANVLRNYDFSLVMEDGANPTKVHVTQRMIKGDLCAATAQQLAATLTQAVHQMLLHPNVALQKLDLFTERDHEVLAHWNPKAPRRVPNASVVDVIWQHSLAQPNKMAIESWNGRLTYSELRHVTARLARSLLKLGVGPEVMVPVVFNKSIAAIVAELAILQAGGAFVPLDPAQPDERLQGIINQVRPLVALTAPPFAARLSPWVKHIVAVEVDALMAPVVDDPPPLPRARGNDMAYVLFTSGSTGKPKGCVVEHGALAEVCTHAGPLRMRPDSRVLQFASYSFGVSLIEIYCTLSVGATACIPSMEDRLSNLSEFIRKRAITWAFLTPSTALAIDPDGVGPTFTTLALAGEPMGNYHRSAWANRVELFQAYGLTEWAGICCVSPALDDMSDLKVIGQSPAANLWLVDPVDPQRLAPVGTVAELVIEGPSLAREYLNDPERTGVVFLENPAWMSRFGRAKSSVLYRTGDLVQYQADGAIRYIARKDTQVKIRGKRLELGEVEHQIRRLWPGIERVISEGVRPADAPDSVMLAAFIFSPDYVPHTETDSTSTGSPHFISSPPGSFRSDVEASRQALALILPEHMRPSVYVPLRHVPLTITGKIDRRALREAAASLSRSQLDKLQYAQAEVVVPQTPVEKTLHAAVAAVLNLGLDQFGIHDSFLRLGGDSIKAMRLANHCKSSGLNITVTAILRETTIAKMATACDDGQQEQQLYQSVRLDASQQQHLHQTSLAQLGIQLDDVEECFPCTPIQEGILLSQARRAGLYMLRFVWDIRSQHSVPIDVSRLQWAWQKLGEAHPLLRTVLVQGSGLFDVFALQVVLKSAPSSPAILPCRSENELTAIGLDETAPARGTPQLTLCPCEDTGAVYGVLYVNHALVDAMSMSVMQRDLAALYDGDTVAPRGTYSAYSANIRALDKDASLAFWNSYLAGIEPSLFPLLNDRSCAQSRERGLLQRVQVNLGDTDSLARFSEASGVTLASIFKLAWACVLNAYTGSDTVAFGYMTAGRDAPVEDIEDLVGPFINMMVCRVDIGAQQSQSFSQMAATVQAQFVEALPHQRVSMADITHGLHLAGEPLFNTTMTFPPQAVNPKAGSRSLSITEKLRDDPTEYDIVVEVGIRGRDMTAELKYWSSCLSKQQVIDVAGTFSAALRHMMEQPDQILGNISLLSDGDARKIAGWNVQEPKTVSRRVEDLIAEMCFQQPGRVAIDAWDGQLTYGELDRLASHLAQGLEASGVGPENFVPLCFAKCRWISVAILGVIKTGAAFVLLDPSHPRERLHEICLCLSPKVVLCSPEHNSLAASLAPQTLTVSDTHRDWQFAFEADARAASPALSPSQALYAVFTSGSTGKPKGVVMEHQSFCTAALACIKALSLSSDSRVFQFAAYAFDVSVSDNLMPLLAGATICIPSDSDRRDRLADAMNDMEATWITTTPSVARTLNPQQVPTLRTMALGGEAVLTSDLVAWADKVQLLNLYGPAECGVGVTVQPGILRHSDPMAIGWATDAAATWVVDPSSEAARLVPIGAVGELVIEGPLVARCYLNERSAPASSPFITEPAWLDHFRARNSRRRLYRTGDLVRYRPDGSLCYVGRKDSQVKLRGQRIELGEVESHVKSAWRGPCNVVAEIICPSGSTQRPILAAFVHATSTAEAVDSTCQDQVLDLGSQASTGFGGRVAEVMTRLQQTLPSYMVPAVLIPLRWMPLGKTGKTDRRLLRQLMAELPRETLHNLASSDTGGRPARTPTEQKLQGLFAAALAMLPSRVCADSHFFRIGGDSIVAMNVASLAREQGLTIAVADIFQHPQLSALAAKLDKTMSGTWPTTSVPVLPFSMVPQLQLDAVRQAAMALADVPASQIEDIYPCTALQEGMLALTTQEANKYVAQLQYRICPEVDVDCFRHAWQRTADDNAILRTRIVVTDSDSIWQAVCCPKMIEWRSGDSLEAYLIKDRSEEMSPATPLVRFAVIEPPADAFGEVVSRFFVLTIHHALYDGWTLPLLLQQADRAYRGETLTARPFSSFVRYIADRDAGACESFWRSEFADLEAPVFPALPVGFRGRPNPSQLVKRTVHLTVPGQHIHSPSGATLSNTIRLAWAVLVSQYTGSNDVVFGVTVAGRSANLPGIADLTGPTIATHPFRVKVDGTRSVYDALEEVQLNASRAIQYEQIGLQRLRNISAEAAAACSFQSHLGIQTPEEEYAAELLQPECVDRNYAAFASYAWVLVCELPRRDTREVNVTANYDPRILSCLQATRLVSQFAHVLRQLYLSPQLTLGQIEVASPEDVQHMHLRNALVPSPYERTIHELVLRHAADPLWRNSQALSSSGRCLTFAELDSLSAKVAQVLVDRGLHRGSMVPLCFDKSIWPVIAMVGVLRAGGAVVNVDPALPQDRIRDMLDESKPSILLCCANNASLMRQCAPSAAQVMTIPADLQGQSTSDLTQVNPTDAAFIIFTSGSTGKPKGIIMEHVNLATSIRDHASGMNISQHTRALHFAAYAFDASIYEIFSTLVSGGCVCIPDETERLSRLAAFISEHRVNWALLTPSAVSVLQPTDVPALETLVLGGEALTHENVETWRSRVLLINAYGPAEATICCAGRISAQAPWRTGTIGPILGACGWVTVPDDPSRLAPPGAVGELLLEGPVVTREYLDRPEQTQDGFIDAPDWLQRLRPSGHGRLYRSRDLVEMNEHGWIRFIGRKDTQVKLRGQRIELGEVERHLRAQWPDAHEIVAEVVRRQNDGASSLLVAFVQPAGEADAKQHGDEGFLAPPTATFSEHASRAAGQLQSLLPPYMVPSTIFPLARVPLSRSDKIDRRRLREEAGTWSTSLWKSYTAQSSSIAIATAPEKPQTAAELTLQDMWAVALGIEPESAGREDNFFFMGGESIAAMKLAAMASRRRLDLTVAQVFAHPCLKDMAAAMTPRRLASDNEAPSTCPPLPFSLLRVDDDAAMKQAIIAAAETQCNLARADIEDIYPCTALQEGLMALTIKQPGAYSAVLEYECPPDFDLARYHAAWDIAAGAHPILRTRVIETESHGCLQVVLRTAGFQCKAAVDPAGFRLGVPLLQLAASPDRLTVCLHHTIYDGWSLPLLLAEVDRAWTGQTPHPEPFSPLIAHQQLSRDVDIDYWKTELAGAENAAVAFPEVHSEAYTPQPDCTMRKTLAVEPNTNLGGPVTVTVASRLRLSWAMAVMQYTGSDDVVFGITTSGRAAPIPGIEGIIGPTIATTPARIRGIQDLAVAEALQRVQDSSLQAMRHEHLGLQHIRRLTESTAAATGFHTLMVIQSEPRNADASNGLFGRQVQRPQQGTVNTYPLLLMCHVLPHSVTVEATYDSRVLETYQMERILRQLQHIFTQLLYNATTLLKDLPIVNPTDVAQLFKWSQPSSLAGPFELPVQDLIERRASLRPDAAAVHAWDGRLTYSELSARVSQLARALLSRGVTPGTFVPLLFEKSCFTVVAQLAVLRAGAAFLLLDASSPLQRLQSICKDIAAPLILASKTQMKTASSICSTVVEVAAKTVGELIRPEAQAANNCPKVQPSDAAYVVFTSGSTGKPKGVVVNHASLAHSVQTHVPLVGLNPASRVLQFAGYTFDIAIMDHISTLVAGGCICVPSDGDRQGDLAAATRELDVNWACLTSSVIRTLTPRTVPSIRTLVQAGEPISQAIIDCWASSVTLINGYGPAECTILSSIQNEISPTTDPRDIGYPCGGRGWVVDAKDPARLLPIGAVGELVLEGPLVAQGYLNDPARMAASFIEQVPAWPEMQTPSKGNGALPASSSRLYRTGDLVRYGADGRLLYHGRRDRQVKLRGQRIELADIEHHISKCFSSSNEIRDVVVELVSLKERAPFLAAFSASKTSANGTSSTEDLAVDSSPEARSAIDELEHDLQALLPSYMAPSVHLAVSHIPLDKSGKVDRRQLCALAALVASDGKFESKGDSVLANPTTDLERRLQAVWARVLNRPAEKVGVLDNFFHVGGDSISAMQVSSQCSQVGMMVRAADLYKYKNIAELAAYLSAQPSHGRTSDVMQQVPEDETGHWVTLSPIQQFFFHLSPEGENHFNQSFFLRLQRPVQRNAVRQAIDRIVSNHSMLRARFRRESDGQWMQTTLQDVESSLLFKEHFVSDRDAMTQIAAASQRALDFQHGPVISVDLMQSSSTGQQHLFISVHHLVIDLVSWRVILSELEDLLLADKHLVPEPVTYLRWCHMQEAYAAAHLSPSAAFPASDMGKIVDGEDGMGYWQLGDEPNTFGDVDVLHIKLDQATTDSILGAANGAMRTRPVELIQAALLHAFVRTFPTRAAPLFFTEGHGREPWNPTLDLGRTVGWFTSIWPTAVDAQPSDTLLDVIRLTKDARRRVPANGWAYFSSRFHHPEGKQAFGGNRRPMEILFNYLGRYQQLERPDSLLVLEEPLGHEAGDIGDAVSRFALIDISAHVSNGHLSFKFLINRHMRHREQIKQWVLLCQSTLEDAAITLVSLQPRLTMAECAMMQGLSYRRLDEVLSRVLPELGVPAADVVQAYPCSPVQRGILLAQALNPTFYKTDISWRIAGTELGQRISTRAVENAWLRLLSRHDMLRTIFIDVTDDGLKDQLVLVNVPAPIRVLDNEGDLVEENDAGFDLDPLHRVTLRELHEGSVQFRLHINHALIDGASLSIIKHELALAIAGKLPPPLAVSAYQSYVEYLGGRDVTPMQQYWQNLLRGREPCHFPVLSCLTGQDIHDERKYSVDFGSKQKLLRFCDEQGISTTVVCHLAWAMVLHYYTGQESVSFGFVTSGRDLPIPGIEHAVGPFINVLVATMSLRGNQSVSTVLDNHQQQFLASLEHQHHPMADVHLGAGLTAAGLFNTLVSVQMDKTASHLGEDKTVPCIEQEDGSDPTEYPITVSIGVTKEVIGVSLAYWASFLSDEQAHSLTHAFRQVLSCIISQPSDALMAIPIVGVEDQHQICRWQDKVKLEPERTTIHDLIQDRFNTQPSAPAICDSDGTVTYEDLDRMSSLLAVQLYQQAAKLGPETFIPLCFEKSKWTIVAILAVLKTGSAFVLLDPSSPLLRLHRICQDIRAPIVITSPGALPVAAKLGSPVLVANPKVPAAKTTPAYSSASADNAAYIIFTSGTTGTPKGILISHESFCSAALAQMEGLGLNSSSRVLQFASYSFDACLMEILTTLISGGCVCIATDDERRDRLAQTMTALHVNWACLTPSVARVLCPQDIPSLQTMVMGGEASLPSDLSTWAHLDLLVAYGPAECAVVCMLQRTPAKASHASNIGFGLGAMAWIVDPADEGHLLPIGAVGELVIEGPSVGRGYLENPEQAAKSFITPPGWRSSLRLSVPACRMYKTGDLVQYTPDGSLRFMGRKDSQVKVRGQRIELGEVEAHVGTCFPDFAQVAVDLVQWKDASSASLMAFIATGRQQEQDMDVDAPRSLAILPPTDAHRASVSKGVASLTQSLPSYMVPVAFLPLQHFPLSKSGKLDRKLLRKAAALLTRDQIQQYNPSKASRPAARTTATTSQVEAAILESAAAVLGFSTDNIGADDEFFVRGGDSVSAMKLVGVLSKRGYQLSVKQVFQHPRFADLALHVDDTHAGEKIPANVEPFSLLPATFNRDDAVQLVSRACLVDRSAVEDVYTCTALQEGLISLTAKKAGMYVAHFQFDLPRNVDLARLREAWAATSAANSILRTRIVATGKHRFLQAVVREELQWQTFTDLESYHQAAQQSAFALGTSLVRYAIIQQHQADGSDVKNWFMLQIHHALYDGWSLPLLLAQVTEAYQGKSLRSVQFAPFIKHVQSSATSAKRFWRQKLSGTALMAFPALPSNGYEPRPSSTLSRKLAFPASKQAEITVTTVLRLAWAILSAKYTLSNEVVFGVTVNGRAAPVCGIETLTGPTLATVPFDVALDRRNTIIGSLRELQQRSVAMFGMEQVGLQTIAHLGPEAASACRFQTLLVVQQEAKMTPSDPTLFSTGSELSQQGSFATYPLLLDCHPCDAGITVHAQYDANVIPEAQMHRILYQLEHILAEVVERPDDRIADIGLGADDWNTLRHWNAALPPAADACVHDAIKQHSLDQPHASAVCAWDGEFTYEQLDQLSTRLACVLVRRGVKPESFVPVYMDKSRWVPVSMLAVLKAGAAFMLLDISHPIERLRSICHDIDADVVLTSLNLRAAASQLAARAIDVDEHATPAFMGESTPLPISDPHSAAYIVFTSGSTGQPKGAVVEHCNLASSMAAHAAAMNVTSASRVFQFASHAFDATVAEILTTLRMGGCVCIPSEEERKSNIPGVMARMEVNWAFLTPAVARILQPPQVSSLKTMVMGGEPMKAEDFARWSQHLQLIPAYGPTECTIFCAAASSEQALDNSRQLGRPLGSCAWIVDPEHPEKLAPIGAVGELLIEGPIVCRGYLKQPEKTAAAFIEPPEWLRMLRSAASKHEIRLYLTGDLVQYATDGTLLFVGRKDNQVKVHGQRIELGEVELQVQRAFRQAHQIIVELIPAGANNKNPFLCACVCQPTQQDGDPAHLFLPPSEEFRNDIADAESELRDRLPSYMMPDSFIPLAYLPLTQNGKTNRKLLVEEISNLSRTALTSYRSATVLSKRAPATAPERNIHQLVTVVLNLDPTDVGMEEDFFRLGGDSITAMILVGAARQKGLALSVPDIFGHSRLADLAQCIEQPNGTTELDPMHVLPGALVGLGNAPQTTYKETVDQLASHYGLEARDIIDILPTTQFQRDYLLRKVCNYFVLDIPGPVLADRIQGAVDAVITKYSALRTVFLPLRDTLVQVPLRRIDNTVRRFQAAKSQVASYAEQLARVDSTVKVQYGAIHFRATLVSADDNTRNILILRLSHAQYDGFSLARLYADLSSAYSGRALASAPDYTAYIVHRNHHITTSPLVNFWREYLAGSSVTTLRRPAQDGKQPETAIHLHQEIFMPALPAGVTLATLYKAAWALILARHTQSTDLVFGQIVNGRSLSLDGIENILGACVHAVPVRVKIHPSWRVRDLLQHIQDDHVKALGYETVDLDDLIARCTDWAPSTRLETIAQHQNVPVNPEFRFADVNCTTFGYEFDYVPRDLSVISVPKAGGMLSIDLSASSCMVSGEVAALLLDGLCELIVRLAEDTNLAVVGLV